MFKCVGSRLDGHKVLSEVDSGTELRTAWWTGGRGNGDDSRGTGSGGGILIWVYGRFMSNLPGGIVGFR